MKLTRRRIRKKSSRVKRRKVGRKTKNRRKGFRKKRTKGRRRRRSRGGGWINDGVRDVIFRESKEKAIKIFNMVKNGNSGEANKALGGASYRREGVVQQLETTTLYNSEIDIENKITYINNAVKKGYALFNNRFNIDDAVWARQKEARDMDYGVSARDLMTHMEVWDREVMTRNAFNSREKDDIINDWTIHLLTP